MPDVSTLQHKPDLNRARRYWDALWQHQVIDRPCTLVTAARTPRATRYARLVALDDDFSDILEQAEAYLESHAFLGESIPAFRPGFGPDQMAAFLGAPLTVSRDENPTSWSEKIVKDWDAFLPMRLDERNRYFERMKAFHAAAESRLAGRCLLTEIDMHSNIDLLEGLAGAENLLYDMIDHPATIMTAMTQARAIYRQIYETFHAYGSKDELGTISELPMYDRGRFNRIQADFIALLSPDLFRRFVLPAIEDEAGYLDRSCFHLDGPDALNHLDDLLAIRDLDAVQWVSGAGSKPQIEWPDVLRRIQKAGKIIILHLTADDVRRVHGEYDPNLLVYDVRTESVEEGQQLLDWLTKHT
ncbi:MAG: hypothetical protein CMJ18_00135 [Phycisphaeraceae bacterium]|nr:hypothetical protein [Phycisphaeraceae bacterium]